MSSSASSGLLARSWNERRDGPYFFVPEPIAEAKLRWVRHPIRTSACQPPSLSQLFLLDSSARSLDRRRPSGCRDGRPAATMMRLKVASASELPAPGGAAIDILACDLSRSPGRRAVQLVCGKRVLHTLLGRRARFVAVMIGAGGRHVVEYSEADFTKLGAEVIDFVPFALGPIILTHFGLSPELREKILVGAKRRDLDTAEPAGHG